VNLHIHHHPDATVLAALQSLERKMSMSFDAIVAGINSLTAQVAKIGTETDTLLQKVTDLQTVIDSMNNPPPELTAAFDALKAQVQVVDDKVADAQPAP
jgi:uncharacterized protein YoxC